MFKNIFFKLIYVITAVVILINTIAAIKISLFPDINQLPVGVCVYTQVSPIGDKTFNMYVIKNNAGCGVRGEVTLDSGETYNVFWQTGIDDATAFWADNIHIVINDMAVNVTDIPYDCRNGTSLFAEGIIAQPFMEENTVS